MSTRRGWFPFTAEQTVNILSEFGPLVVMFIVNAAVGWHEGTYALVASTVLAIIVMYMVLKRLPVFPLIASAVSVAFAAFAIYYDDPKWIVLKVTVFNALFAVFLFAGLALKRNFFKHIFDKTFHYTDEGWNRFTFSFAWFFVLTAVLNEAIRHFFPPALPGTPAEMIQHYNMMGYQIDGLNVWILFKVAFIMPLSGLYAWYLTRLMSPYRIPDPAETPWLPAKSPSAAPASGGGPHGAIRVMAKAPPRL